MKKLILRVDSGIISVVSGLEHLNGVQLEIRDYDCEGCDIGEKNMQEDEEGNEYFLQEI